MSILKQMILVLLLCQASNINADNRLPAFSFPDTNEQMHSILEWSNKTLVINFWATWCQSCLKEIPEFIALQSQYSKKSVQFIGIAIDDIPAVTRYKATMGINYPILVASEWEGFNLAQQLGNESNTVPYTVVVNSIGQIIYHYAGTVKKEELISILSR